MPRPGLPAATRFALFAAAFAVAAPGLHAAPDDAPPKEVSATVKVRHGKASALLSRLLSFNQWDGRGQDDNVLPTLPGVKALSANDAAHSLSARGDQRGISQLRELVKMLDQPTGSVKVRVTLGSAIQSDFDTIPTRTDALTHTDAVLFNNESVETPLSADGVAVENRLKAHLTGDGSIILTSLTSGHKRLSVTGGRLDLQQSMQNTRRLKIGETYRVPVTPYTRGEKRIWVEFTLLSVAR